MMFTIQYSLTSNSIIAIEINWYCHCDSVFPDLTVITQEHPLTGKQSWSITHKVPSSLGLACFALLSLCDIPQHVGHVIRWYLDEEVWRILNLGHFTVLGSKEKLSPVYPRKGGYIEWTSLAYSFFPTLLWRKRQNPRKKVGARGFKSFQRVFVPPPPPRIQHNRKIRSDAIMHQTQGLYHLGS